MQTPPLAIIDAAASLWTEPGNSNPEYERALVELCSRFLGFSPDDHFAVRRLIEVRQPHTQF